MSIFFSFTKRGNYCLRSFGHPKLLFLISFISYNHIFQSWLSENLFFYILTLSQYTIHWPWCKWNCTSCWRWSLEVFMSVIRGSRIFVQKNVVAYYSMSKRMFSRISSFYPMEMCSWTVLVIGLYQPNTNTHEQQTIFSTTTAVWSALIAICIHVLSIVVDCQCIVLLLLLLVLMLLLLLLWTTSLLLSAVSSSRPALHLYLMFVLRLPRIDVLVMLVVHISVSSTLWLYDSLDCSCSSHF